MNWSRLALVMTFLGVVLAPAASAEPEPTPADTLLAAHAGRVVLVDFWASWCVPCRKSFPWMAEMTQRYGKQGFDIIAINVDRDRSAADAFLEKSPLDARIVYDPKGQLAGFYELERMPSSFLYARDGALIERHVGFSKDTAASLEASIGALLAKESTP